MWVSRTVDETRRQRRALAGRVALVPTMGALHRGHVSLIHRARELADHVVVTVFVNPTQFGPTEDFSRYPRPIEKDLDMCRQAGATGVFNPGVEDVYPESAVESAVNIPSLATILEGAARPTHFGGVCRVVAKLFNICQPDVACFGKKDYQQLAVIRAMVNDLNFPLAIEPCPTMREADGLAMSSRNVYLTAEQRPRAIGLYKALQSARAALEADPQAPAASVEAGMHAIIRDHGFEPGYSVIRHPRTLQPVTSMDPAVGVVALVAARLGSVRLIDNLEIGVPA